MYEPIWRRPSTADEVSAILSEEGEQAGIIAGGTDLAMLIACRAKRPPVLIDLTTVDEISHMMIEDEDVVIGATVTHEELSYNPVLIERALVLSAACRSVGSPQIRARGTIGGNVANASPAADGTTALVALDALARVRSGAGVSRGVPLRELLTGPGTTSLEPFEFIEGVEFELPAADARTVYLKSGQRNALAISVQSAAVVFDPAKGRVSIALGSVAPTPVRADAAERLFAEEWIGAPDRMELLHEVAAKAVDATECIDDIRATASHRRRLVEVLVGRALTTLCIE